MLNEGRIACFCNSLNITLLTFLVMNTSRTLLNLVLWDDFSKDVVKVLWRVFSNHLFLFKPCILGLKT